MKNITYRSNYLTEVNINGFQEYDMGSMNFHNYDFGEVQYYMTSIDDVGRPDLISFKIYGTTNYWWFILWFNGICDPWNDLRPEMVLKYPNINVIRTVLKRELK